MAQFNVSFGTYNVICNAENAKNVICNAENAKGKGVKVFTMDGILVHIYAKIDWWNTDAIVEALERDKDKLIEFEKQQREKQQRWMR